MDHLPLLVLENEAMPRSEVMRQCLAFWIDKKIP